MRLVPALVLAAGVVLAAGNPTPADDKKPADKEKKMQLPDLTSTDWKKQTSGLEIWDVKEGKGDAVKAGGKVKVHYTGWLTNGKVFDSSVARNEPIEFPLTGVIKGWQEGIPGMKPGGVRRLFIPAALGYAGTARPGIPANSDLVFEVIMVSTP